MKRLKAFTVFIYSDPAIEYSTKNGGAPWLPVPSIGNNDKHFTTDRLRRSTTPSEKEYKMEQLPLKQRLRHEISIKEIRNRTKKQTRQRSNKGQ